MKKHLLFNQSFGTVGSPNQTGETLTRENRIGLMSYLHRTLMLLFAVLVMSIANIGMAWGATEDIDVKTKGNTSTTAYTGSSLTSMSSISFTATGGSASIAAASGSYTQFTTGTSTGVRITFTPKSGVTVNALEFTLSSGNNKGSFTYSSTNAVITNDNKTHTLSGLSLSSAFDIYCHLVSGSSSQSIKVTNVKVTYTTGTPRTFKSGDIVYFQDASGNISGLSSLWKTNTNNVYAYFWNDTEGGWTTFGDKVSSGDWDVANAIYKFVVPGSGKVFTKVKFTRGSAASDAETTHQTSDQTPATNKNMFTVSTAAAVDGKYNGSWGVYSNGPAIAGDMNNWLPDGGVFTFDGSTGSVIMNLEASTDYQFKVLEGTTWRGNTGTITSSIASGSSWLFETSKDNCTIRTGEAGEYAFKWDNTNKKLWVSYPGDRFRKNTVLYFDAGYSTNWQSAEFDTKFFFRYYDTNTEAATKYGDSRIPDTNHPWVFYTTTPDDDYVGKVQIMRMKDGDHSTQWNYADQTLASSRSSALQNCLYITEAQASDVNGQDLEWKTYCPPMSSATLSDNSTSMVSWQSGNGTSANPYLVSKSGTIKVSASATKAVPDPDMTPKYDFKVSDNGGATTSAQSGTGSTYDKGSLSANHTYEISLDAWNNYNSTDGTKYTTATHLWYKAVQLRNVVHTLTNVTKSAGRVGDDQAADNEPYTATFAANTGYNLPATITVKFGGTTKTAGTDYTWDSSTGIVSIPASKINGNVTIIIAGVAKTTSVTLNPNTANHGTGTNVVATATYNGTSLSGFTAATPADGYRLEGYYTAATSGEKILNANGSLVKNTTYTTNDGTPKWKSELASLELFAHYVDETYTVSNTLTNATKTSGETSATHGTNYTAEFAADGGYTLPSDVTVTIGGSTKTKGTEYTWDQGTGTVTITGSYILGNISITVTAETAASLTAISADVQYNAADMANITFTSSDQHFTGLSTNHLFKVYGTLGTSDAFGKNETISNITDDISEKSFTSAVYITTANNKTETADPTQGAIEIITPSTPGILYLYLNSSSSGLTLKKKGTATSTPLSGAKYKAMAVDANTHYFINGSGSDRGLYAIKYVSTYSVSITPTNVTKATGEATAIKGKAYTATFTANTGYTLPSDATVTIGGTPATKGTEYTWSVSDDTGTLTVKAANVTGAINISVVGETPSGHTVTYNYNGADGGSRPESATGASVTLPTPTKSGCTFQGWYTSGGTKAGNGGATYNPEADITLYALWRESCAGGSGNKTLVDINFKDASWTGKTFSQANDNNEDLINGVYFWSKSSDKHFSLADNTSKGLTFPNSNMSSGNTYFCIPITGINSSDKQITVTLKHGYGSNKASYKYVYIDGRTTFEDGNTNGSGGESVSDAANADTQMSFTKGSLSNTSGHLIIGRNSSSYTQIYGVTVTTPNNATCYYVTYNGNGADGGFMTDETAHGSGDNVAILANTYTREGYTFTGWKTEPSSGTSYSPEGTISSISSNITLYAQWSAGTLYSVTYNGNGATSGSVPVDASSPYSSGSNVTVLGNTGTLALANYTFDGWATANDGTGTSYTADGTISGIAADVELFAKWKQTVTLNTGSQGSEEEKTPYIYINGAALNGFSAHSAAGYTLNGYYSAASGGTKVLEANGSFAATDVANYVTGGKWSRTDATTLYAQWRAAGGASCNTIDHISDFPSSGSTGMTVGNLKVTFGGGKTSRVTDRTIYSGQTNRPTLKIGGNGPDNYVQGYLGGNEISSLELGVSESSAYAVAFSASSTFDNASVLSWSAVNSQYTPNATSATSDTLKNITVPSGAKYFRIYRKVSFNSIELGAGSSVYVWHIKACTAGASTHTITYANGGGTGTMTSDADIADDGTKTLKTNTFTAPTNYSFAGWVADGAVTIGGDVKAAGTLIADGATITNITMDIALTAKWTQSITLNANTSNHGTGDNTSATVMYNATALSSISHTSAESGYKLTGYFTADTDGTKVLNSDGTFAGNNITDWISDGKWICEASTRVLYAQYESSGSLIWNLTVNSSSAALVTSSKVSAFTEIAAGNMTDAECVGISATADKRGSLTGKIDAPASYGENKYVKVTFQVASGYKFIPNSVKVKFQPVSAPGDAKLVLEDNASHIISKTQSSLEKGKITTVEMINSSSVEFTGTVTLKIYCYGSSTGTYRLGTPISIDGEVEELCATMPSFTKMNYTTTTFTPNGDATGSPISIEGGENINTYQWKYNTTNDRTSGTNCGTNSPSLVPLTDVASGTTRYYWCEMTNTECNITIKSPAVAITVNASKSDATISWTGTSASANYGGGGYTVKATVNETEWNGNAADLTLSAPAGIRIYSIESGETASKKWVQASFDVTTAFDRETYSTTIPFVVSADATATYNAISDEHALDFDACIGGGGSSEEYMPVDAPHIDNTTWKGGWVYSGIGMMRYSHGGSAVDDGNVKSLDHSMGAGSVITKYYKSSANHFGFYTEKAINGVRLYVYTSNDKSTVSGVYIANSAYASGTPSTGAVTYEATYYNDDDGLLGATNDGCTWVEITFDSEVAAGKYGQINLSKNVNIAGIAFISSSGSGAKLNTHLQWSGGLANNATVNKKTTDAYFTYSASMITENTNSLGAITYSSSDPSVATVDATGKVAMVAAGTTTIKATLAASGCYKKAEISYTLNVTEEACAIAAGTLTLTSGAESKCSGANVTLTLTGFESGADIQWKDGDTNINNGGNYTIATDGTTRTSTLTTNQEGTYSVIVTKGCFVRSNRITIKNASAEASVSKIIDEWYIKQGRLTPDIALFNAEGATSFTIKDASTDAEVTSIAGCTFELQDDVIYLHGYSTAGVGPTGIESAANETIKVVVTDACGNEASVGNIIIHKQIQTDKHVLAFVVRGKDKGGFTDSIPADQTTSVGLYNAIAANFDVLATNSRATDDEQKLKEYYSQFDILCITDYPDTKKDKGVNGKSTVDALGALVDIRPILTMEAWVSGLANWRAKGISGSPKSPTTRQYTMDLQCKDHEIFARTTLTKVGEGDEAMYRVSMVDNTKEDYATLDATYGSGAHAEKEGYQYGKKPALQGFTFTQEMSDNDLLPIGLIDDGAGNNLQVGIERQHNMEARLMVLGINSYAMERLTDDGERVVINALNYLMKKNAEDIADCSTAFVGGAEGAPKNWNNADNWTGNTVPLPSQKVRILADCEVSSTVHALDVLIVTDGKYNHGSDNAAGKLTIKENGALIVGGKIQAASAPAYNRPRATTPDKLLIETSDEHQAALIFDNEEAETQATVNLYSLGRVVSSTYQFQYMAVPMEVVPVSPSFANEKHDGKMILTYVWKENGGWERRGYYEDLRAFEGVGITTNSTSAMNYTMKGNLASTSQKEIALTNTNGSIDGFANNIIGNSWTAPIDIASLKTAIGNDNNVQKTIYIYVTGNDGDDGASSGTSGDAGQWLAVPIDASGWSGWNGLKVIPAMQAFLIRVNAETSLELNYKEVVRKTATENLNEPLRAPRRAAADKDITMTTIHVADSKTYADLRLFEGKRFDEEFDNGWEAEYLPCDGRTATLYAETEAGQMAVAALPELEGTVLGFAPGKETEYTFTFLGGNEEYYLNDLKLKNSTLMSAENSYTFTFEEGDAANRFYISRTAINAPAVATGMENLDAAAPKVQKIIYNDKLYIIRGGRLYDATGKVVK